MPIKSLHRIVTLMAVCASLASAVQAQEDPRLQTLATAAEGGTYYPVGVAIALLARIQLQQAPGIDLEAITTSGSVENLALLREGTAQFGILQALAGDLVQDETAQTASVGSQDDLRAVAMLWPDVQHFLLRSDLVQTGTIDDLANLTGYGFSIGAEGSGTDHVARVLLSNYGLETTDWGLVQAGPADSVRMLIDGQIGGMTVSSGMGADAITEAFATMGDAIRLLAVTDEQATRLDGGLGILTSVFVPAGTYPGLEDAVQSVAVPTFLAVRADVPEEDVYQVTRLIFENLDYLCEVQTAACALRLETAVGGLPLQLHPGAARYFEEQGVADPGAGEAGGGAAASAEP